jgi:hypothetical protein
VCGGRGNQWKPNLPRGSGAPGNRQGTRRWRCRMGSTLSMPGHFLFAVLKQQSELDGETRAKDLKLELPILGLIQSSNVLLELLRVGKQFSWLVELLQQAVLTACDNCLTRLARSSHRLWKWLTSSPHRLWKRYYYKNPAPIAIGGCNQ